MKEMVLKDIAYCVENPVNSLRNVMGSILQAGNLNLVITS